MGTGMSGKSRYWGRGADDMVGRDDPEEDEDGEDDMEEEEEILDEEKPAPEEDDDCATGLGGGAELLDAHPEMSAAKRRAVGIPIEATIFLIPIPPYVVKMVEFMYGAGRGGSVTAFKTRINGKKDSFVFPCPRWFPGRGRDKPPCFRRGGISCR